MKLRLLALPLLSLVLAAAVAPQPNPVRTADLVLKSSDHDKIGKKVADYFKALSENKEINEAFDAAAEEIDKVAKKSKDEDVLTMVEDWEAIFATATSEFHDHKKYKKQGKLVDDYSETSGPFEIAGALFCPKDYNPKKGEAMPLVLVVPDEADKEDPRKVLEDSWQSAMTDGPALLFVVKMPNNVRVWDEIGSPPSETGGISAIMFAFGHLKEVFRIDVDRVFLAGHGRGIGAAVATAAAFPHVFAGVVGRGGAPEGMRHENFSNLPSLFLSGGTHATAMQEALKGMGVENCTVADGSEPEAWAWIREQVRDPYPTKLRFTPTSSYSTATSWLTLDGIDVDAGSSAEASFDRESNTITIDAQNVIKVQVFFNDLMADLSKPVKVVLNGEVREQVVPRNRKTLLDMAFRSGDWGRVFVNRQVFDVPIAAAESGGDN